MHGFNHLISSLEDIKLNSIHLEQIQAPTGRFLRVLAMNPFNHVCMVDFKVFKDISK